MKKLIFTLLFLSVCGIAHAVSLSEVLEWKYGPVASTCQENPNDKTENPKMIICGWKSSEQKPDEKTISKITQEYLDSQDYQTKRFDIREFFGRLIQEMDEKRWLELSKTGIGWTMQQLVNYPNFDGLKTGGLKKREGLLFTQRTELTENFFRKDF